MLSQLIKNKFLSLLSLQCGDPVVVRISAEFNEVCCGPRIDFEICTRLGILICEANTYTLGHKTWPLSQERNLDPQVSVI